MTREELMKMPCWSCWYREGGNCFSKAWGDVPRTEDGKWNKGYEIDNNQLQRCLVMQAYQGKRQTLESFFGNIPLVIMSEESAKKNG